MFYDCEKYKFDHIDEFIKKEFKSEFKDEIVIINNEKKIKRYETISTIFEIDFTRNDLIDSNFSNKPSVNDTYYK